MRFGMITAAAGLAAMLGAGAAQAAPLTIAPLATSNAPRATLQEAVQVGPAPKVELVRGRCGFGAHRTYSGRCHLNYGVRGRIRARHGWYRHHFYR